MSLLFIAESSAQKDSRNQIDGFKTNERESAAERSKNAGVQTPPRTSAVRPSGCRVANQWSYKVPRPRATTIGEMSSAVDVPSLKPFTRGPLSRGVTPTLLRVTPRTSLPRFPPASCLPGLATRCPVGTLVSSLTCSSASRAGDFPPPKVPLPHCPSADSLMARLLNHTSLVKYNFPSHTSFSATSPVIHGDFYSMSRILFVSCSIVIRL